MRSFKDFDGKKKSDEPLFKEEAGGTATELTKKLAAAWNGKNSGEMLMQILAEAERGKRNGTLSNAEIDEFYNQFSPFLNAGQKRKLQGVVDRLKRL
ncbi:MAG: hypothetical protein IIX01_03560 [Clostridia bacterium]|nr:hypothetical protein [Clostridia bacterium]